MLDWDKAGREAQTIAAGWRDDGPGGAIVLFDRDGVRASFCGGLASIEHGVTFTAETPTRFASISKHFTATLLLRAGVPLEATLGELLDGLAPDIATLPLGRALDMTGALPDMMEVLFQQGVPFTTGLGEEELLEQARRLPGLNAVAGTEMAYSNTGWRLGQAILQKKLGISQAQALRQLVEPLGLPLYLPRDETEIVPGLATGYWRDGELWRRGRYGMHFSGSGGMAGSAAALAGWASMLMAGRGPLAGLLEQLTAPRAFADGSASVYRLGLVATALDDLPVIAHGGSLPGYRNHLLMAPGLGAGIVLMGNREEEALWPALRVLAALTGRELPGPPANAPSGLYASDEGPFWAEFADGAISFMNGFERLVDDGEGGMRSLPAYLDIRLRREADGALSGAIGGVRRVLRPVPAETALDPRLVGTWRSRLNDISVTIRSDGSASFPWTPIARIEAALQPLPGGRAIASLAHGPWQHRPCFWLPGDGTLRLASHRARILQFDRIGTGDQP